MTRWTIRRSWATSIRLTDATTGALVVRVVVVLLCVTESHVESTSALTYSIVLDMYAVVVPWPLSPPESERLLVNFAKCLRYGVSGNSAA